MNLWSGTNHFQMLDYEVTGYYYVALNCTADSLSDLRETVQETLFPFIQNVCFPPSFTKL